VINGHGASTQGFFSEDGDVIWNEAFISRPTKNVGKAERIVV
jgi:hypothetical protein